MMWKIIGQWTGAAVASVLFPLMPLLNAILKDYFNLQTALTKGPAVMQQETLNFILTVAQHPHETMSQLIPALLMALCSSIAFIMLCRYGFGYVFARWEQIANKNLNPVQ